MLEANSLKAIIQGETSNKIKAMRQDFAAYVRHVFGKGTDEYLAQINEYENAKQHELRKKHAIENPWIIEELVRPVDNIWQAKGGDETYTFTGETPDNFIESLNDVRGGMSLHSFMKEIWFQRFVSDPNGVIFLEVSEDGKEAHYTYKAITKIKDYHAKGINIDWIVFEPDVEIIEDKDGKEEKVSYSWAVDEKNYYKCKNSGADFAIVETLPHTFGMVPGVINSSIFNTDKGYKVSPLERQIGLLNSYLTKNSVKEIYQMKHNYAIFWMFQTICPTCNGARKVGNEVCGTCGGTGYVGRKDVSDAFVIPKPEQDITQAIPPAGYVQPSVETCTENRAELDWLFDKMYHSLWGTTVATSENETATGRFIDTMPVYNKLNMFADIAQTIHRQLAIIWGKFKYPITFQDAKISYSRRYVIETPDTLWKRYQDARKEKSPEMSLNYMLEQFYYSEFASNKQMADYYITLMYVEPYVHSTIEEVEGLTIQEEIKLAKRYFPEWQKSVEPATVETKTIEQLTSDLYAFAKKIREDEMAAASGEDIQKLALNGAQVSSLVEIMGAVTAGTMPKESAKYVILQAFPAFNPETIDKMLSPIKIIPEVPANK